MLYGSIRFLEVLLEFGGRQSKEAVNIVNIVYFQASLSKRKKLPFADAVFLE